MVTDGPKTLSEAMTSPVSDKWRQAIDAEMQNLDNHGTFEIVDPTSIPNHRTPITSRMVLQTKYKPDGSIDKYKARLVAHGFKQKPGLEFNDTYAPLVSHAAIRLGLSKAAALGLEIDQLDVVGAFLEAPLDEEIYMTLPKGIVKNTPGISPSLTLATNRDHTFDSVITVKLLRSLYGCKQAALNWFLNVDCIFRNCLKLHASAVEPGVYYGTDVLIMIWVDDMLVIGERSVVDKVKKKIGKYWKTKDLGGVRHLLGFEILRYRDNRQLVLRATGYIDRMLERFGMSNAYGVITPLERDAKFYPVNTEDVPPDLSYELTTPADYTQYHEIIGSITYLATSTRPDIAFAAGLLGRFAAEPSIHHLNAAFRILRYLRHTRNHGLHLGVINKTSDKKPLHLHCDSDYAGAHDYHSTSGLAVIDQYGSLVHWKSSKQQTTAKSTADAEYTAIALGFDEAEWLKDLEHELDQIYFSGHQQPAHDCASSSNALVIYNDNTTTVAELSRDPKAIYRPPSRRIGVLYNWIHDMVKSDRIHVLHLGTNEMLADGFTKGLKRFKHLEMLGKIGVREIKEDEERAEC